MAHKEELLALLRRTAHASTREEFESAITVLENFHVWKSNKALRHWFQDTWLAERERWVWAFRQDRLQVAVNTNNGLERQNEDFKYNHLANHRDKSLSGMLSVLITDFLPEKYSRYMEKNVRCHRMYRTYNKELPEFLVNRPRYFVEHCTECFQI